MSTYNTPTHANACKIHVYVQIYCKRRFTAILVAILATPVLFTKIKIGDTYNM